jgi:polar amino acid transport system permease protein
MAGLSRGRSAAGESPPPDGAASVAAIRAVRLRHPWRVVAAAVLIAYLLAFLWDALNRKQFEWDVFGKYIFDRRISEAAFNTIQLTVYSMLIGIVLALILAVMRLSPNPVFKSISWFYLWIFRGTPVYVQLTFWGLLAVMYPTIELGLPFVHPFIELPTGSVLNVFQLAVIGLGLNEAAYLAEIIRAGILSVDRGQEEASTALGMTWLQTMRRVVIPQSMRVIIPPTGNEFISMLKTTSLVTAVPYSFELYSRSRDIAAETFAPIGLFLVASAWYLAITSILMVGQYFLEKRFARGIGTARPEKPDRSKGEPVAETGATSVALPPSEDSGPGR